jgi:hypothetical protein
LEHYIVAYLDVIWCTVIRRVGSRVEVEVGSRVEVEVGSRVEVEVEVECFLSTTKK